MKKILFLQPSYAHYREDLFALLSKRHNIHFLFEKSNNPYPGKARPSKISCDYIDKKFKYNLFGLVYFLFKYDGDIIVSSVSSSKRTIVSFLYAAIFRKKFILWILQWKKAAYKGHGIQKVIKPFRYLIARQIIYRSHAVITGGTVSRNFAVYLGIDEKKIFTAPQCSNDVNKQNGYMSKAPSVRKKYTFLFLGRILSWKGLDILIKAFHRLRQRRGDVFLLIAGDGPLKEYCFNLTQSLNVLDVEFIGSIFPNQTKHIYKRADVFVLPSYELEGYHEDWGLVVNEAMSMKLPVIATTAVGASFDMINNGYNGFIVSENSVGELYYAMDNILKYDLIQMGNNSRKIFEEKNNYSKMANGFSDAIAYVR
jgi:glycosyltransferase involved in cell wall biosynthesis